MSLMDGVEKVENSEAEQKVDKQYDNAVYSPNDILNENKSAPFRPAESEPQANRNEKTRVKDMNIKMKLTSLKISSRLLMNIALFIMILCAGLYFYYESGHKIYKELPYTKFDLRMKANAEKLRKINAQTQETEKAKAEARALANTNTTTSGIKNNTPVKVHIVEPSLNTIGNQSKSQALFQGPSGNINDGELPRTEHYYLDQLNSLSQDFVLLQGTVNGLVSKISNLEASNTELKQQIIKSDSTIDQLRRNIARNENNSSVAATKASSAEQSVHSLRSSLDVIASTSREIDRNAMKNELGIESLQRNVSDNANDVNQRMSSFEDKLVELTNKLGSKTHIQGVPNRVDYLNGNAITTVDPNISIKELQSYGAKVSEKVIPDYHFMYAANGRYRVIKPDGVQVFIHIGEHLGVYGQVMDFIPNQNSNNNYLITSSGFKLTTKASKN